MLNKVFICMYVHQVRWVGRLIGNYVVNLCMHPVGSLFDERRKLFKTYIYKMYIPLINTF